MNYIFQFCCKIKTIRKYIPSMSIQNTFFLLGKHSSYYGFTKNPSFIPRFYSFIPCSIENIWYFQFLKKISSGLIFQNETSKNISSSMKLNILPKEQQKKRF